MLAFYAVVVLLEHTRDLFVCKNYSSRRKLWAQHSIRIGKTILVREIIQNRTRHCLWPLVSRSQTISGSTRLYGHTIIIHVYHSKCTNISYHYYFSGLIIRCKKYFSVLIIHCTKNFAKFIFVPLNDYKNIFAMKISRFTVLHVPPDAYGKEGI